MSLAKERDSLDSLLEDVDIDNLVIQGNFDVPFIDDLDTLDDILDEAAEAILESDGKYKEVTGPPSHVEHLISQQAEDDFDDESMDLSNQIQQASQEAILREIRKLPTSSLHHKWNNILSNSITNKLKLEKDKPMAHSRSYASWRQGGAAFTKQNRLDKILINAYQQDARGNKKDISHAAEVAEFLSDDGNLRLLREQLLRDAKAKILTDPNFVRRQSKYPHLSAYIASNE